MNLFGTGSRLLVDCGRSAYPPIGDGGGRSLPPVRQEPTGDGGRRGGGGVKVGLHMKAERKIRQVVLKRRKDDRLVGRKVCISDVRGKSRSRAVIGW